MIVLITIHFSNSAKFHETENSMAWLKILRPKENWALLMVS